MNSFQRAFLESLYAFDLALFTSAGVKLENLIIVSFMRSATSE